MARSTASTVEEYLAELPPERVEVVAHVRDLVLANLPDGVVEAMNGGMIAYQIPLERYPDTYNGEPLMFAALAAQKRHYALYLYPVYASEDVAAELEQAYADAGVKLDAGRSCVRFTRLDRFVDDAVARAIRAVTVEEYLELYEASRRR